jgi:hypothetical protein
MRSHPQASAYPGAQRRAEWAETGSRWHGWTSDQASRARFLWHVTANEASPTALTHGRLDTRQDTPPDAFRV